MKTAKMTGRRWLMLGASLGLAVAATVSVVAAPTSTTAPAMASTGRDAVGSVVRASRLIGAGVRNEAGERLGSIGDLVVDTNTGRVHYAVLSYGGVAGAGERLFALPLPQLRRDGRRGLIVTMTRRELESAPAFDRGRWPNWNDDAYRAEVDRRFNANAAPQANTRYRRATDVLQARVHDAHGADIGRIKDMIIDLEASRIRDVVVSFDRAWSPRDKVVALSMSALSDGATTAPVAPDAHAAAPPRSAPPVLAFESPTGQTKGTASAVNPPGSVETRPPAIDPGPLAKARPIERAPLRTTRSYDTDEDLVFKGTREDVARAPDFDSSRYRD
jgi:sporulation protein YlmC with PRC-barrel domain